MLRILEVPLALPEGARAVPSMGSLLHGVLMERLPSQVAARLHREELRPFGQCVRAARQGGGQWAASWRIATLGEELFGLVGPIVASLSSLELRQKGYAIGLGEPRLVAEATWQGLADAAFLPEEAARGASCRFLTPTSFKRAGEYQLFPEAYLIVRSLLARWQAFSPEVRLDDADLAEKIAPCVLLRRYQLRSAPFHVEQRVIYGFQGEASFRFAGTGMVRRILALLFSFAPYAGLGIKTALGMGAVEVAVQQPSPAGDAPEGRRAWGAKRD